MLDVAACALAYPWTA